MAEDFRTIKEKKAEGTPFTNGLFFGLLLGILISIAVTLFICNSFFNHKVFPTFKNNELIKSLFFLVTFLFANKQDIP